MISRLEIELHPMKRHEILCIVFSFCSVNTLKNCRLVGSKLWLNASLKFWREKAVLRIKSQPDRPSRTGITFSDLQRTYETEEDLKQFRSIGLQGFSPVYAERPELVWIFTKYSANLKHLTLEDCQFSSLESFMDIIFFDLPNLVELKLMGCISVVYRHHYQIDGYPRHPNLKRVILGNVATIFSTVRFPWETFLDSIPELEDLQIRTNHASEQGKQISEKWKLVKKERNMIGAKYSLAGAH